MNFLRIAVIVLAGVYGSGSYFLGLYMGDNRTANLIEGGCRDLGAFVLNSKFYACEPKEWNHSNLQE